MAEIVVREAGPEDYDRLHALIARTLQETGAQKADVFDAELWRWQCLTPGFETLVVVAEEEENLAGCFHLVSKDMSVFGQPGKVALLQELAVLPEYRRRGVFMQMSEFARDQMAALGWDVTYSMPNLRSYPGFIKHQGYRHLAWVPVRLRPLDAGGLLASRLSFASLWRALGKVMSGLYDAVFRLRPLGPDDEVGPIARFSSEVDSLARQFLDPVGIGLTRNARFLNWRFLDKPGGEFSAWGLRREGRLLAYLVTRRAYLFGADCVLLMDFGCLTGEEAALLALISARLAAEREDGATLAVTAGRHPLLGRLGRLGFVRVPRRLNPHPMPLIAQRHTNRFGDEVYEADKWFISLADWDVL